MVVSANQKKNVKRRAMTISANHKQEEKANGSKFRV